jgi:hypothetical protein
VDRCDDCGFVYDLGRASDSGPEIVAGAGLVAELLMSGEGDEVRSRSGPATWSVLEYTCHVRDVLLVQRERILTTRRMERPSFHPMGRDERAVHDGYGDQCPVDVARQLRDAASLFANVLERLEPEDWERTLVYNYPNPSERSLKWVAVHTEHEVRHHLKDVLDQLDREESGI